MRQRHLIALAVAVCTITAAVVVLFFPEVLTIQLVAVLAWFTLCGTALASFVLLKNLNAAQKWITARTASDLSFQLLSATNQVQALIEISNLIPLRTVLPPMGGWAVGPDFAGVLVSILLERSPRLVVEASSGVSTMLIAYCLERTGGKVVSLDHLQQYSDATNENLSRHNLTDTAKAIHAPLKEYEIRRRKYMWYDLAALEALDQPIDVLVIDGPPKDTQKNARYPALPLLASRLAPNSVVLLDDASRPDEQEILRDWVAEFPDFRLEMLPHLKGTAVLRRTSRQV